MKKFLFILLFISSLSAKDCSPYFNPEKFNYPPEYLQDLIDTHLGDLELFGSKNSYKILDFKEINKSSYLGESINYNQLVFPKKSGVFTYKVLNNKVDELTIANVNLYKYSDIQIAEEINNDFEGFWYDWIEDAYEMQLVPEQVLFHYNKKYFSLSVFIYGIKDDATRLNGTTIKYRLKDYTKQVNEYIQCMK